MDKIKVLFIYRNKNIAKKFMDNYKMLKIEKNQEMHELIEMELLDLEAKKTKMENHKKIEQ